MTTTAERNNLEALLEDVRPGIFALCYRLVGSAEDAEDLTQEALLKMSEGYARFEGRSRFRTWAYRIATNTCYNFLKSARKRREVVVPDPLATTDEFLHAVDPDADLDAVRESLEFSFICVLQELSPLQRLVVVLRDVLGWSVKETAAALGSAPAPIKNIHSRARRQLKRRRPDRESISPNDPEAERFMHAFAKAHVERNIDACLQFFDEDSVLYAFPTRKYHGRKEAAEFYAMMREMMPTLFIAVKMNGNLGAACYHPSEDGTYRQTGVAIIEIHRPRNKKAPYPHISQIFWALEPEHYKRIPVPAELPPEKVRDVGHLL